MNQIKLALLALGLSGLVAARAVDAAVTHQFANADSLDNDVAGSTTGPFTDPVTGVTATITTISIGPSGALNTIGTAGTNGRLGINGPGTDESTSFDDGESWTMAWSQNSQFVGISFKQYTNIVEDFAFAVQSPEWVGLAITPGSADVVFTSASGTFTFSSQRAVTGSFTEILYGSNDLYGVGPIPVVANTRNITFSYSNGGEAEVAGIGSLSFNLLIPEPSTVALMVCGGVGLFAGLRTRRNR